MGVYLVRGVIKYRSDAIRGDLRGAVMTGMRFFIAVLMLCAVCALTYTLWLFMSGEGDTLSASAVTEREFPVIVIDAGHGGVDGGAVAPDGGTEKEINLAVAKKLAALCEASGIDYVLTRTEDSMLVGDDVTSHRKMHDLKNRLALTRQIIENGKEAMLVSIHMNNFSSAKYSGLQVWYSPSDARSSEIAAYIQSYARTWLDNSNTRQTKAATSAIYLLDRADFPAVLVECGFLSNPEEYKKLTSEQYQTDLAAVIFSALCDYMKK